MASDYLLELDGIKGESTQKAGAIEIMSFSWGVTNTGAHAGGGGGGAGKASFSDLHFSAQSSKATPHLRTHCASGKHIAKAVLWARLPTADPGLPAGYLKIELENIMVSSMRVAAGDVNGDGQPDIVVCTDQVTLNFRVNSFFDIWPDLTDNPT